MLLGDSMSLIQPKLCALYCSNVCTFHTQNCLVSIIVLFLGMEYFFYSINDPIRDKLNIRKFLTKEKKRLNNKNYHLKKGISLYFLKLQC